LATTAVTIFHLDRAGVVVVGQIPARLPQLALPPLSIANIQSLTVAALGIALVGYSDNVLTARVFASRNGYKIDANQELLALGCCNLVNGLMQGFPISSSGSRTAIGESLGSKTQLFSVVAFALVIVVLLFLRPVLALFPKAALGAIVIYAASRLIEIPEFVRLYRFRSSEFRLALVTTLGVLFTDIIVGVVVAVILSMLDLLTRVANPTDAVLGRTPDTAVINGINLNPSLIVYRYDAPLCFANAENFKRRALDAIENAPQPVQWFILNAEAIGSADITAIEMLMEFQSELGAQGIVFGLVNVKSQIAEEFQHTGFLDQVGAAHIFPTLMAVVKKYAVYGENA
jgi:MFS superfamily sulfate permease-like transporter